MRDDPGPRRAGGIDLKPAPAERTARLVQVAQHAEDLDRAAAFCTALLGRGPSARFEPPGLLFFELGGGRLLLERGAPSAVLSVHVTDVHETVAELRSRGVAVEAEPHVIFQHEDDTLGPAGTDEGQAFVRDSEGNLLGLVSQLPAVSAP